MRKRTKPISEIAVAKLVKICFKDFGEQKVSDELVKSQMLQVFDDHKAMKNAISKYEKEEDVTKFEKLLTDPFTLPIRKRKSKEAGLVPLDARPVKVIHSSYRNDVSLRRGDWSQATTEPNHFRLVSMYNQTRP